MKKYIWAIAAVIMVAGTITFVVCNNDNNNNQIVNPSYVSAKGGSTLDQLRNVMVAYYTACDSAYQADSTTFLSACANNDTTNFLKVTGISSEMLSAYRSLALQELEDFIKDNPSFKPDENPCTSCSYNALPRLGALASATSGHMVALAPFKIGGNDRQRLANCISWCEMMTTPCGMTACLSACMGEYKYDLFANNQVIASYTKGNDCIAFDIPKDQIMSVMETYISSIFGEVVIEDIKIIDEQPLNIEYNACMEIDFFNVEKGTSSKISAIIVKEIDATGESVSYKSNNQGGKSQVVNCTSDNCGQGECKVMYDSHGTPEDCTNCKKACHKSISSSDSTPGFWDVVIAICIAIASVGPIIK